MTSASSRRHKMYQPMFFILVALVNAAVVGWTISLQLLPIWLMIILAITAVATLVMGAGFLLSMNMQFGDVLRHQGNLNRRIQEAHLEQERLTYEVSRSAKIRRNMQRSHDDQSRAMLKVADVLNVITTEVQISAATMDLDRQMASKLDYLTQISADLMELLQLELEHNNAEKDDFLVVDACRRVIRSLQVSGVLGEKFILETDDQDARGVMSRKIFESLIQRALIGLAPFAAQQRMDGRLVSFIHGDLGDCIQITIAAHGQGITDEDAKSWFTQFQLHYGNNGELLGPGLGMMIVARYTETLGGQVSIESQLEQRLTLSMIIPLNAETTVIPEGI
ncbi:ATP-binding protein [Salinispirillum marinum]|uniref:ATP-binding protein n=2 Tax=Saccharospirillaceae TaxID=255527 RepID=A0ABV8BA22_9GAMM